MDVAIVGLLAALGGGILLLLGQAISGRLGDILLDRILGVAHKLIGHRFVAIRARILFWVRGQASRVLAVIYGVFLLILLFMVGVFWLADRAGIGNEPIPSDPPSASVTKIPASTETPASAATLSFSRPTFQSAEEVTRSYYDLLADGRYEIAYSLLNKELKEHPNFAWDAWLREVTRTTYEIIGDLSIQQMGNMYRVEFNLLSNDNNGIWTHCVSSNNGWEIQSFYNRGASCP
ncbi:MAG: hypothetical protein KIT08_02375 [Anaerolineales bacterium]|nr:MAG: hypothetical protein KIT08_02375 [Anaerolineales bacterium]